MSAYKKGIPKIGMHCPFCGHKNLKRGTPKNIITVECNDCRSWYRIIFYGVLKK